MLNKCLNNNSFCITVSDECNEHITIQDIKDSIKALSVLGIKKESIKVSVIIFLSGDNEDYPKDMDESDIIRYNKKFNCYSYAEISLLRGNYILIEDKFKLRVNIDESYTYNNTYYPYFKNTITRLLLTWE